MKVAILGMLLLVPVVFQAPHGSISGHVAPEYTGLNVSLSRLTYDDNGVLKLLTFLASITFPPTRSVLRPQRDKS